MKTTKKDFWRMCPKEDAKRPITLFPNQKDIESAIPGDSEHCIYAQCIRRVLSDVNRRVRIWRTIALIEFRRKSGPFLRRYMVSKNGRKALELFDKGIGTPQPCTLLPPPKTKTLASRKLETRSEEAKERKRELAQLRRKQKKEGTYVPINDYREHMIELGIRDGTGHC